MAVQVHVTSVTAQWAGIAIDVAPIAYAIGIVENAEKRAAIIEGAEPEDIATTDARLLQVAKGYIPTLPFKQLDVLVVPLVADPLPARGV